MTKKYYETLGVSEIATLEEIKKAYRKLAQQWHPDKWNTKSLQEREEVNKKMQEINRAYEILSDEDKRKRYDLGETEFTERGGYNFEEDLEKIDVQLEVLSEKLKVLARKEAMSAIDIEKSANDVFSSQLDSNLWTPYSCYQEKIVKIEIKTDSRCSNDIDTSKLDKFKEEMITAIRKRGEELKAGINNPRVDKERKEAIAEIERELNEKGLKTEDLPQECRNYREQINSLPKVWQIRSLQDEISEVIRVSEKPTENSSSKLIESVRKNRRDWNIEEVIVWRGRGLFSQTKKELMLTHSLAKKDYDNRGDLIIDKGKMYKMDEFGLGERNEIEQILNNYQISIEQRRKKYVSLTKEQLVQLIIDLEDEIQRLNSGNGSQQEIQNKELLLQEAKVFLNEKGNNPFPIIPIISVVSIISLLGLITYKVKKNKIEK